MNRLSNSKGECFQKRLFKFDLKSFKVDHSRVENTNGWGLANSLETQGEDSVKISNCYLRSDGWSVEVSCLY